MKPTEKLVLHQRDVSVYFCYKIKFVNIKEEDSVRDKLISWRLIKGGR